MLLGVRSRASGISGRARLLLLAMLVDTLGSGFFAPFELLYGHAALGLSLPTTGTAIGVASALAIAAGPLAGGLVDRLQPAPVAALANLVGAVGAVLLLVHAGIFPFLVAVFLLATSSRMFWAAFTPLVGSVAPPQERETWFGRMRTVRYAGLALGMALAGAALSGGRTTGLAVIVVVDSASYLVAMVLTFLSGRVPAGAAEPSGNEPESPAGGYSAALRDRANTCLALLNVACTVLVDLPMLAMPVYALETLGLQAWLPGTLAALGTGVVAVGSSLTGRLARGRARLGVLAASTTLWAAGAALFVVAGELPAAAAAVLLAAAMVAFGSGEAGYAPTADTIPLVLAPPRLTGRYAALHQMAWGVSSVVAPPLAGWLLEAGRYDLWYAAVALAGGTALAYLAAQSAVGARVGRVGQT